MFVLLEKYQDAKQQIGEGDRSVILIFYLYYLQLFILIFAYSQSV